MKYFSMFSGIGGFDLALNRLNHSCVGYSEIDKYAIQVYKYNFGDEVKNYGDATKINTRDLPDFDILCGGFPCQSFSIAGHRKGFEDTRGTLFFEIARIAKAKQPKIILLENVKGLLNHNKGETFRIILQTLWELGYRNLQWMVLNSKFFGVPQNRERVFIIGYLRGEGGKQVLPFREDAGKVCEISKKEESKIISPCVTTENAHIYGNNVTPGQTLAIAKTYKAHRANEIREHKGSPTLTQNMGTGGNNVPLIISKQGRDIINNKNCRELFGGLTQVHTKDDICQTLIQGSSGGGGTNNKPIIMNLQTRDINRPAIKKRIDAGLKPNAGSGTIGKEDEAYCLDIGNNQGVACAVKTPNRKPRQEGRWVKEPEESMFTLNSQDRDGVIIYDKLRRLTPVECERLQSFPDLWTAKGIDINDKEVNISDTQRYRQLGNAVTVNVVYEICKKLWN